MLFFHQILVPKTNRNIITASVVLVTGWLHNRLKWIWSSVLKLSSSVKQVQVKA